MACQWTDEQTGGHCPTLAERFTGTDAKWFTFTNGTHVDSLDPETFNRWYDFLELYVAKQAPDPNVGGDRRPPRRSIYQAAMGVSGVTLPARPDPARSPTYAAALAAFEALPPVRILFDNGAGGAARPAGARLRALLLALPGPGHARPAPGTSAPAATLARQAAGGAGADAFTWDAAARGRRPTSPATPAAGTNGLWTATPALRLDAEPGRAPRVSYVTRAAAAQTRPSSAPARVHAVGPLLDAATSTCRRRSPRSGPTARRPSCRAAGCGPTSASSTRRRARLLEPVLEPPQARRRAAAGRPLRQGHDPALLPGPRLPGRVAHPRHDLGARRRPADLGVRRDDHRPARHALGRRRAQRQAALAAGPAGRSGARSADRRCRPARACAASPAATTSRSRTRSSRAAERARAPFAAAPGWLLTGECPAGIRIPAARTWPQPVSSARRRSPSQPSARSGKMLCRGTSRPESEGRRATMTRECAQ